MAETEPKPHGDGVVAPTSGERLSQAISSARDSFNASPRKAEFDALLASQREEERAATQEAIARLTGQIAEAAREARSSERLSSDREGGGCEDLNARASSETLAEPDEAALVSAARHFLSAAVATGMVAEFDAWSETACVEAMRAALSSLTVTGSGE